MIGHIAMTARKDTRTATISLLNKPFPEELTPVGYTSVEGVRPGDRPLPSVEELMRAGVRVFATLEHDDPAGLAARLRRAVEAGSEVVYFGLSATGVQLAGASDLQSWDAHDLEELNAFPAPPPPGLPEAAQAMTGVWLRSDDADQIAAKLDQIGWLLAKSTNADG